MNNLLKKNIALYSGIAGAFLITDEANAQVVYTDIIPDFAVSDTGPNSSYVFDFNQDGYPEFYTIASLLSESCITSGAYGPKTTIPILYGGGLVGNSGNMVLAAFGNLCLPFTKKAAQLSANTSIDSANINWTTKMGLVNYRGACNGGWSFGVDYYAGIKFYINNDWHIGWVRIQVIDRHSFVIKDYAYELQPGVSITAGRTSSSVGIEEIFNSTKIIQDGNHIQMNFETNINDAKITISNIMGQEISSQNFSGNIFETEISSKGIFLISLSSEKSNAVKKVFIY